MLWLADAPTSVGLVLPGRVISWSSSLSPAPRSPVNGSPRTAALRLLGNGVVPLQGATALRTLLAPSSPAQSVIVRARTAASRSSGVSASMSVTLKNGRSSAMRRYYSRICGAAELLVGQNSRNRSSAVQVSGRDTWLTRYSPSSGSLQSQSRFLSGWMIQYRGIPARA